MNKLNVDSAKHKVRRCLGLCLNKRLPKSEVMPLHMYLLHAMCTD